MRRCRGIMAGLVAVVGLATWTCLAQEPEPRRGAGRRVGEKLDEVIKDVKQGARDVTGAVREQFAKARASVNDMGVTARVYGRLHWDKALNGATIDLETTEGGVVTLKGSVPDAAAKTKAETLAAETVGVSQVVSQLVVAETGQPPRPSPVTTRPKAKVRP